MQLERHPIICVTLPHFIPIAAGLIANIPWIAQSVLDHGLIRMLLTQARMLLAGSIMFFAFRLQTTSSFFMTGLMYGGAQYIPTGRGFAYRPMSFTQLYHLYGRTHLQPGAELTALLITVGLLLSTQGYSLGNYAALTWPMWIYAVSLIFAPFWFNPASFTWGKVRLTMTSTTMQFSPTQWLLVAYALRLSFSHNNLCISLAGINAMQTKEDWRGWNKWIVGGELDAATNMSWDTWNRWAYLETVSPIRTAKHL